MKHAFTLIELLVVIAIIGLLAGVLIASFSGATESARAAQCISNLKSLAMAANAAAMYDADDPRYPLAGSREAVRDDLRYTEITGWISWLSCNEEYGNGEDGNYPTSHRTIEICPFYGTDDPRKNDFALSNGSLWNALGQNKSVYVCPTHRRACQDNKIGTPLFSYVMNAKFGYDFTKGTKSCGDVDAARGMSYGSFKNPDRMLMFAELPATSPSSGEGGKKNDLYVSDCVLNYKGTVDGKTYGSAWDGEPESIGFNHKAGKKRYCAHVVFMDGHTEKLQQPEEGGQLDEFQLTALLCEGQPYAFDGSGYKSLLTTQE